MLIDQNGKIAFKGHPANRPNLEQDLDDMAAGKALTGEGTFQAKPAGGNEEPAEEEGFKVVDAMAINAEIDTFKEKGKAL